MRALSVSEMWKQNQKKDKFLAYMRRCSIFSIRDNPFENPAACVSHKAMVHGIRKQKCSKLSYYCKSSFFIFLQYPSSSMAAWPGDRKAAWPGGDIQWQLGQETGRFFRFPG